MFALFLAIFLFAGLPGRASASTPVTDSTQVAQHYRQVLKQPQYQEVEEAEAKDRLKAWLSQWFGRLGAEFGHFKYAQEMPRFASMLMSVFVILSIIGLLYTMARLIRRQRHWHEPGLPENGAKAAFQPPEFYEGEIRTAIAVGDWSAAWLASWRQFLSRLEQGHLVEADRSKTNREYLAQLRTRPLPVPALALLGGMVEAYDRFIYGCRAIAESDWQAFHAQVTEATLLLHLQERPAETEAKPTPV